MVQVIWTEPALNNLNDIAEYIALNNLYAAKQLVERVFEKVEGLEQFPNSGKVPEELPDLNYRELVVNPCRVFYKVESDAVYILNVLRQERNLSKYILSVTNQS
jgi:plasmid stabilization system protein ParE